MPNKRRWDDYQNHSCAGGDKRPRRRKCLYVALDDWKKGFSIYKIDADSFSHPDDDDKQDFPGGRLPLCRLPPPVLQLESPIGGDMAYYGAMSFSALGAKIFAFTNQSCALVYNTETTVLAIGPHSPPLMVCGFGRYMRVGDMLYALSYHPYEKKNLFFVMSWGPTAPDARRNPTEGWSWKSLPSPPPKFNSRVASYVLHPDECTIFITTNHVGRMCTYSFDTKHSVWTWLGDWALPFLGQGHFDTELDAWVGLRFDGSICSCQVVSPNKTPPIKHQQLDWKMTKEKLVNMLSDNFRTATLTCMGRSKYCLAQTLARDREERHASGDHNSCLLHLTMFGLKYNHKGELETSKHQSAHSFLVSRHRGHFRPAVFWM